MTEVWLPIRGFEGIYSVSTLGRIKRDESGKCLVGSRAGKGYRKIILHALGRAEHRYIHEMVLETFVGPRSEGMEACHGNGVRDDNRLENLRWDTRSGNFADKIRHGTATVGEKHGRRKLSASDVRKIRASAGTCKETGQQFGICAMQVSRIRTRKNWSSL